MPTKPKAAASASASSPDDVTCYDPAAERDARQRDADARLELAARQRAREEADAEYFTLKLGDKYLRERIAALREAKQSLLSGEPAAAVLRTLGRRFEEIAERQWRNGKPAKKKKAAPKSDQ